MTWTRILTSLALLAVTASCGGPAREARTYRFARTPANTFASRGGRAIGYRPDTIVVGGLPPAPYAEVIGLSPYDDAYWIEGYWDWDGYEWVWIPGHWESPPAGFVWIGPNYNNYGSDCEYTPPHWAERDRGTERPAAPEQPAVGAVRPGRPSRPSVEAPPARRRPTYTVTPNPGPADRVDPTPVTVPNDVPQRPTVRPTSPRIDTSIDRAPRQATNPAFQPYRDPRPSVRADPPKSPAFAPSHVAPPPARSLAPTVSPALRPSSTPAFSPVAPASRIQSFTPPPPPPSKPSVQQYTPAPAPQKASKPMQIKK